MLLYAIYGILTMPRGTACGAYYSNCGHSTCQTALSLGQGGCYIVTRLFSSLEGWGLGMRLIKPYSALLVTSHCALHRKVSASWHTGSVSMGLTVTKTSQPYILASYQATYKHLKHWLRIFFLNCHIIQFKLSGRFVELVLSLSRY